MGGEIFLEVAGRQALWHTPSWRCSAPMRGGGAQLGELRGPVGGGEQRGTDSFAFPESRTEGHSGSTFLGQEKYTGLSPSLQGLPH